MKGIATNFSFPFVVISNLFNWELYASVERATTRVVPTEHESNVGAGLVPAQHLIVGWIKVLGFITFIDKMGLLTGGISIVVDRKSLFFDRSTQPTELW